MRATIGETHLETRMTAAPLAILMATQGRFNEAFELVPTDLWVYEYILRCAGRTKEAKEVAERILAMWCGLAERPEANVFEKNAYAYNLLKSEPPELRDPTVALRVARTAVEMNDGANPYFLETLAIAYEQNGELDQAATVPSFHCGNIGNPIRMMEMEHQNAGKALDRIREITDDYAVPENGCNSFRAMLSGLEHLEADLHLHIHKENEILFPKAADMEARLGS